MAPILQLDKLTKSYGERILFEDVSFSIEAGDKIGIIAKNGTGKTTLLRIIAGDEDYDAGTITLRNGIKISILEQTPEFSEGMTTRKYVEKLASSDDVRMELTKLITQLNPDVDWDQPLDKMSGGQSKRLALAKTLSENPDLLILDEPTNHLDIKTIEWLENYLAKPGITLLMVTHDRYFLDRICNRIVEIDRQQSYTYPGNYNKYLQQREYRIQVMWAELTKVKNLLRREQEWMSRQPQARAGKARYRIEQYYDLKNKSNVNLSEKNVALNAESTYIGKKIFHAENVSKYFEDKCVLKDFTYDFARYEKIGIIGENGVGKSTFIKMLQGIIRPDSGFFDIGETVSFGYYCQERVSFPKDKKVIDAVTDIAEDIDLGGQRVTPLQYLQHFLFTAKDQQKYISTLSGGELSRLYLATVLMRRPNFLILDEPTNDLDIVTLGILEEYLMDFKGCVLIISHDRYFLDNIVDHLFVMEGEGIIRDFPGNYSDFRKWQAENFISEKTKIKEPGPSKREKKQNQRPDRMSFKEKREFEVLTKEIEELTNEKNFLESLFNGGEGIDDIAMKAARYEEIKNLLDEKELRWLELSEKS